MTMVSEPEGELSGCEEVAFGRCSDWMRRVVRRHAHNVRNCLNVAEVEISILGELGGQSPALATLDTVRMQLAQVEIALKALLSKVENPNPVVVGSEDLLQLWRFGVMRFERANNSIEWSSCGGSRPLMIDVRSVVSVLCELTFAAWQRAVGIPLRASLLVDADNSVILQLAEPPNDLPMAGELLETARWQIHANGGMLVHEQDPATSGWLTTARFCACEPIDSDSRVRRHAQPAKS